MDEVERAFRAAHGQAVATLVRIFGDISLAEDAVQDAFVTAVDLWPRHGIPSNPAGWIITTARNRAIDLVRRHQRGRELLAQVATEPPAGPSAPGTGEDPLLMRDDQLRLIFTCCHPAIRVEHQVALTLRLIAGLTPAQVARGFLISEATMTKRLVRAKYKIKAADIPYRVPTDAELPSRLRAVLAVLYLIYNAGADDPQDSGELRREAIRLTRALVALMPDEAEACGLLALMLLCESRIPARRLDGDIVLLRDQDRSRWDRALIAEGHALVLACLRRGHMGGPFQLQAAIHGLHCAAPRFEDTDWPAIVRFYDRLVALMPTPVVKLNRAVAVAETAGPDTALELVDGVAVELDGYHLLHASRAAMLERLCRTGEAAEEYRRAAQSAPTAAEARFLSRKLEQLTAVHSEEIPMPDASDFFFDATEPLLTEPSVRRGTMMGYPCLRVSGAFFASCEHRTGDLIVKLPADRVAQLVESGAGKPFRPNGRTFREWVLIEGRNREQWDDALREALAHVSPTARH